jgi:hypothetical protein
VSEIEEVIERDELDRLLLENGDLGPLVKAPYLPVETEKLYTLVLDLDETLIHYEDQKDVSLDDPG